MARKPKKIVSFEDKSIDRDVAENKTKQKIVAKETNVKAKKPRKAKIPQKITLVDHPDLTPPEPTESKINWDHVFVYSVFAIIIGFILSAAGFVQVVTNLFM